MLMVVISHKQSPKGSLGDFHWTEPNLELSGKIGWLNKKNESSIIIIIIV